MKLRALRLWNVKRFANRGISLEGIGDGVNVLTAPNEEGKSTSFEALQAVFSTPYNSRSKPVQNLRPYSGGNPRIQVDVDIDGKVYRVDKQFYSGGRALVTDLETGHIIAQADEAEAWIRGQIGDEDSGPTGLFWVRQGSQNIDKKSDGQKDLRQSLIASVENEVDSVTGGQRMDAALSYCTEELKKLVTPGGKPKEGTDYKHALDERQRLTDEQTSLSTRIDTQAADTEERRGLKSRLAELEEPEEAANRRNAKQTAQDNVNAAREATTQLNTSKSQRDLAKITADQAKSGLDSYAGILDDFESLVGEEARLTVELQTTEDSIGVAKAASLSAQASLKKAREKEDEATKLLSRVNAAQRADYQRQELTRKEDNLEKAETSENRIAELNSQIEAQRISAEDSEEIRSLKRNIDDLDKQIVVQQGSVTVSYVDDAAGAVRQGTDAIDDGESVSVSHELELCVDGIGSLTFVLGESSIDDLNIKKKDAARRLQSVLERNNLTSHEDLITRETSVAKLEEERIRENAVLNTLAPQSIASLRTEVETLRLSDVTEEDDELPPLDEAQDAENSAKAEREVAESHADTTRQTLHDTEREKEGKSERLNAVRDRKRAKENDLGPEQDRSSRLEKLQTTNKDAQDAYLQANENYLSLEAAKPDIEALEATLKRCTDVVENTNKEIIQLGHKISRLDGQLQTLHGESIEEKHAEILDRLESVDLRVDGFQTEVKVLNRLKSALEQERARARDVYLAPIVRELGPLLEILFEGASLEFDESTLLPMRLIRNDLVEELDNLSGGTQEQLTILTRLAFARLAGRAGRNTPTVLDDALVFSDDDRIEKMFDAIHRQAKDLQIIVFSCRQRAFSKLGGTSLEITDWSPQN